MYGDLPALEANTETQADLLRLAKGLRNAEFRIRMPEVFGGDVVLFQALRRVESCEAFDHEIHECRTRVRAIRDAGLRSRLSIAAQEKVRREFSIDIVADKHLKLYHELIR